MKWITISIIALGILVILDIITTDISLNKIQPVNGYIAYEANPVMRYMIGQYGFWKGTFLFMTFIRVPLIIFSFLVLHKIVTYLFQRTNIFINPILVTLAFINGLSLYPVINNIKTIMIMTGVI